MKWLATSTYYLSLYWLFFAIHLKAALAYRVNFFVQMWYGPAYVLIMFLLINTAYAKAPILGGLNHTEGVLLFLTFQLFYVTCMVLFINAVRDFMWSKVRQGELDMLLTKPVSAQFMSFFTLPETYMIPLWLTLFILWIRQVWQVRTAISLQSLVLFGVISTLCCVLMYLIMTTYATLAFVVQKAGQFLEFFDKVSDSAQYPITIFPLSFQILVTTLVPTAFMGYVQVLALLGRLSWKWVALLIVMIVISSILQRSTWRNGLKQYASASS